MTPKPRILLVHNAYRQRGGEDAVVDSECALLEANAHPVLRFTRHNDEINGAGGLSLAINTLWSAPAAQALATAIEQFSPNIIHVHNTFPLISPSVYWVAAARGVPVVQTLHNFRLLCPQAMFLREGSRCEDCLGKLPWRGVVHACYRQSRAQTAALGAMISLHRGLGTWRDKVARFIALSEFSRRKFVEGGLPAQKIVVKPNFVDRDAMPAQPRDGYLFVGRLSPEKGTTTLAEAATTLHGVGIDVVGSGPDGTFLTGCRGLQLHGSLREAEVYQRMLRARALLLPSICYENFPRTLVEAYASGLPVIASRIGALAELVEDGVTGLLFQAGNARDLSDKVRWAEANPERMAEMGSAARARYESTYTSERNYGQLLTIYADAVASQQEAQPA